MKDNGGPAFPSSEVNDHNGDIVTYADPGMTVRDWFAGKAVQGMLAGALADGSAFDAQKDPEIFAHMAGLMADAMLAERAKG